MVVETSSLPREKSARRKIVHHPADLVDTVARHVQGTELLTLGVEAHCVHENILVRQGRVEDAVNFMLVGRHILTALTVNAFLLSQNVPLFSVVLPFLD